jgi:hypothetical protein
MTTTTATSDRVTTTDAVRKATRRVVHEDQLHMILPVPGGTLTLAFPPPERLAFYAGLTVAATFGAISWPMALVTGIGHALADDHHNRTLEAVGEAIEAV